MENSWKIAVFLVAIILYIVIITILKKGRIPLKFALVWLVPATIILIVSILPNSLEILTHFLGFETISNMVIGILFVVLIFICISLTIIVSGQKTKITLLIQELSMLKEKVENLEKK